MSVAFMETWREENTEVRQVRARRPAFVVSQGLNVTLPCAGATGFIHVAPEELCNLQTDAGLVVIDMESCQHDLHVIMEDIEQVSPVVRPAVVLMSDELALPAHRIAARSHGLTLASRSDVAAMLAHRQAAPLPRTSGAFRPYLPGVLPR